MLAISIATAGEFGLIVTAKSQDGVLREDKVASYTISYVSSASQRNNSPSYTYDEPRDGSISGLQYRGAISRTVILPENFAQVGDIIRCSNNVLYAVSPPVVRKLSKPKHHHEN